AFHCRADGHAHHGALADRRIAHPIGAVSLGQRLERVRREILSDNNQTRLLAHAVLERFANRVAVIHGRHFLSILIGPHLSYAQPSVVALRTARHGGMPLQKFASILFRRRLTIRSLRSSALPHPPSMQIRVPWS